MELKDIIMSALTAVGLCWGTFQFYLRRKYQKSDKLQDKKFDVYLSYMNTKDEINQNMRTDLSPIYGIPNKFMSALLEGDEKKINEALLDFNDQLNETTKKSVQPLMILSQELNKLKLVCSNELLPKIEEYKTIASEFIEEYQAATSKISLSQNLEETTKNLQTLGTSTIVQRMTNLDHEMETIMRNEIGSSKE